MHRPALMRLILSVGVLMVVILALTGYGSGSAQEEAKARPLPENEKGLRPGIYRSEEFKPSLSFRVGEDWTNAPPEASDHLALGWGQAWGLGFVAPRELYKPTKTGTPNLVDAPEDLVGWYQRHPYLRTDEPEPVRVGGVEGVRFDVIVAKDLPEDHYGVCGLDCVDIARFEQFDLVVRHPPDTHSGVRGSDCANPFCSSSGSLFSIREEEKLRLTVLEDAEGETVTMGFGGPADKFDLHAADTQEVLDSVEWQGA